MSEKSGRIIRRDDTQGAACLSEEVTINSTASKLAKLRSFSCGDITERDGAFSALCLRENALFVA
jgi:hypothetical protein